MDIVEREALALLLRSKTALGRLVDSDVHHILDFLESIGFVRQAVAAPVVEVPAEPAPIAPPPA